MSDSVGILDRIYRQYVEMRRAGVRPVELRLGEDDYCDLVREAPPYGGALTMPWINSPQARVFGVPIKRLPISRAISFR